MPLQRAPLVALSPGTQATLALAQPRPPSSIDIPALRAQLYTLDTTLSTLLDQRLAISARLTEAVALSSPIRLLSAELVAEIFVASTKPSNSPQDAPALLSTLMLVCKYWRDICLCTPDLWTQITISPNEPNSLEKARRRLQRSKALPLHIFLDFSLRSSYAAQPQHPVTNVNQQTHASTPDHLLRSALLLLRPCISRWRTFVLLTPYHPQATAALELCSSPAPMLESLTVQVSNPMLHMSMSELDGRCRSFFPFSGVVPKLRECSFTSFWCECPTELTGTPRMSSAASRTPRRWDHPRLDTAPGMNRAVVGRRPGIVFPGIGPAMTKLRLVGFWNDFAPGIDEMVEVLRQCPLLEDLSLRNMTDIDPPEVEPSILATNPVVLRRLRYLSCYYSGVTRTCALLCRTVIPGLERVELSFLDNITGCLKCLKQQVLSSANLSSYGNSGNYLLGVAYARAQDNGEVAGLSLRSLRIEASLFNELKLLRLLGRLPMLEKLELIDVEDISSNLLRGLSNPVHPNEWILPRLETLNLEGCTTVEWDALKALVESRLPSSSASSSAAAASYHGGISASGGLPMSSAGKYALGLAITDSPYIPLPRPLPSREKPVITPRKILKLDLTRCSQISRERIQWLRMYVPDVVCEGGKSAWSGVDCM